MWLRIRFWFKQTGLHSGSHGESRVLEWRMRVSFLNPNVWVHFCRHRHVHLVYYKRDDGGVRMRDPPKQCPSPRKIDPCHTHTRTHTDMREMLRSLTPMPPGRPMLYTVLSLGSFYHTDICSVYSYQANYPPPINPQHPRQDRNGIIEYFQC